jgi:hypothetical protein
MTTDGRKETDGKDVSAECPGVAARCKSVRSGARLIWDKNRHQPSRGELDGCAPVHRRQPALPWQSWRFSGSRSTSTAKRRGAVASASQAAPPLLALLDSQIVRRQRVSPATMARDLLPSNVAPIDIGEVDDRRTIGREPAPGSSCRRVSVFPLLTLEVSARLRFVGSREHQPQL